LRRRRHATLPRRVRGHRQSWRAPGAEGRPCRGGLGRGPSAATARPFPPPSSVWNR